MPLHRPLPPANPRLRPSLLHGVSIGALLAAGLTAAPARAAPFHSLNQALGVAGHAVPPSLAPSSAVTASKQAALGVQNLARATARFTSLSQAIASAHGAKSAAPPPIVVDGTGPGAGLQAADGAVAGNTLWQGAQLPQQTGTASGVTVDVVQNRAVAQLTWKTFNVGAKTTLNFDQSAGGTLAGSWVAINTVQDATANPTEILGAIHAQGKVYILDRNGIAFGANSTVNVGSLIAATADIASSQFTTDSTGQTNFSLYGAQTVGRNAAGFTTYFAPTFVNGSANAITVDQGASIQTAGASGINGGGYAMLLGGNVANAGLINTPQGQTVLAAGTDFTLRQGGGGGANPTSTTMGSEIATSNAANSGVFATGSVANSGIIMADQGDITMAGHALGVDGLLLSTTTVNTRGTIHLLTPNDGSDPTSSITVAPGAIAEILPEDSDPRTGQVLTALDSQRASNIAQSVTLNAARLLQGTTNQGNPQLNNHSVLADQLGESRVELSSGGSVDVGAGALLLAQGGQIAIGGGNSVLVESGAALDVSGTTNTVLPSSANTLLVNVEPFQTRDSAANRTGPLKGTNVTVDARTLLEVASGPYAGNVYTPGGLIEVGGNLGTLPHGIGEWTAVGGQVTLSAAQRVISSSGTTLTTAGSVATQAGSLINIQGGSVTYAAGPVAQSYVVAADGTIYNINDAPGNLVYTGLYQGDVIDHARWQITDTYTNPLATPATIYDPAYTVGRDAGVLTVNGGAVTLLGAVPAGVSTGLFQQGPRPAGIADPYLLAQTVVPLAGTLAIGNYVSGALSPQATNATDFTLGTTLPPAPSATPTGQGLIDTAVLNADGLGNLSLSTGGSITVAAPIVMADGGTISLTGATVAIGASITARAGSIAISDQLNRVALGKQDSVTLASGATLDTRGVWTNGTLDPTHLASLGFANGGTVSILSAGGVTLQQGSRIDVSSGGAILPNGRQMTATGGSIAIAADIVPAPGSGAIGTAPVELDAAFIGYGSKGGGTLSLTAPAFQIGAFQIGTAATPAPAGTIRLVPGLFSTGFAHYVVNGTNGLDVLPGTQLSVAEPIYLLGQGAGVPSGGDPSSAYTMVLPPLYTPVRGSDVLTRRAGAGITLLASIDPTHAALNTAGGGTLTVGAGASISVDPGQSITLAGYGQTTVLGTLTAHGGTIDVANTRSNIEENLTTPEPSEYAPGVSVWLGATSLIDVSGEQAVQTDAQGSRFGLAGNGGTISLGDYTASATQSFASWAQVILRPGARLDADGAQATIDVLPGTVAGTLAPAAHPVTLAGDGGLILARSLAGVALDGSFSARGGDAQASGGTLSLQIDATYLNSFTNIPATLYRPREILVSQNSLAEQVDASLLPGQVTPDSSFGQARISQQQITAGGVASLNLAPQGGNLVFVDNVALQLPRGITLTSGVIGDTVATGNVSIASPHVTLAGYAETIDGASGDLAPLLPTTTGQGTLAVQANLLDISDTLYLGGGALVLPGQSSNGTLVAPPILATASGFAQTNLASTGDIRFLGSTGPVLGSGVLLSTGNITLTAAQLYPTSGGSQRIVAGYNTDVAPLDHPYTAGGTLAVIGTGAAPQNPYSVGGTLELTANTILQGGIVRAPEGVIRFDDSSSILAGTTVLPSQITLAPGSVTSVSLAGQTIPYGGTVDGVTYLAPGGVVPVVFDPQVQMQAQSIDVQAGATIDLRGGGTLSGAGFVFGRGGSTDVLTGGLLDITAGAALASADRQVAAVQPVRTGDTVYAILPGYGSAYAPLPDASGGAYSPVAAGQQITVGSEVAGLAAGTYTLLPASFALLPGAFRVELTSGQLPANTAISLGNYTSVAPVTLSVANTSISSPVATDALFTSATNIRQLAQYDEESYNSFEQASSTQFGAPRPLLPQDAKTLLLSFPSTLGSNTAFSIAPASLLKSPDPVAGGYGATLQIDAATNIYVQGPGDIAPLTTTTGTGTASRTISNLILADSTLSALDMPRLLIGGTLGIDANTMNLIDITPDAASVTIMPHAVLRAGDVMLTVTERGQITVAGAAPGSLHGGTISSIGAGPASFDTTDGYYFNNNTGGGILSGVASVPVLDVSNGLTVFAPNTQPVANAAIVVGDGAGLLAGGSLDVVAPGGTEVSIGAANLGARYADLSAAAINVGSAASLAAEAGKLPTGIDLTADGLATLLNGSALLGTPAAAQLTLTATQNVNIVGSVALNTGSTDLVLNTPAIYGVGTPGDTASISTSGRFTWSGVAQVNSAGPPLTVSAMPGGQVASSLAAPSGTLSINAGTIVLGYGPQTQPNDQVTLDRLVAGFSRVALQASSEITANNQSALSVFQSFDVATRKGTGGDLALVTPLLTTNSAAVLTLSAGGLLTLAPAAGGLPAATAPVTTQGGEIDIAAGFIGIGSAVALPAGRLVATAQDELALDAGASIDLAGRTTHIFDQTVNTPGGSALLESTTGSITLAGASGAAPAASIDVSSPGNAAGSASFSALAGAVTLDGTLRGSAGAGQQGGSFTVLAFTLASAFDTIDAGLNAGGFTALRSFEFSTDIAPSGTPSHDLLIGNAPDGSALLAAHTVSVTDDAGSIDIAGTIDASGSGPGSIALSAAGNLVLEAGARLDAHANSLAVDSSGQSIDAENRAHVTLTTQAGSLTLLGGSIDLGTPISAASPLGQLVLNAPRVGANDVAIDAASPVTILGAQSVALYAWRSYAPADAAGTIRQSPYKAGPGLGSTLVSIDAIDADNTAFMAAAGANMALAGRLVGLTANPALFHLRPGVEIDSSTVSKGTLTISGDLDFSGMRYSDVGYGSVVTHGLAGSGEPGSILFRAAGDLIVNGSVSDGFLPPPDIKSVLPVPGDTGWAILSPVNSPVADPLNADIILPSSIEVVDKHGDVLSRAVRLGAGTTFDSTRPISLNYDIRIAPASVAPQTLIPFAAKLDSQIVIPAGGYVTTSTIGFGGVTIPAGTFLAGGTIIAAHSVIGAGTVLPVTANLAKGTLVPAGTLLSIFGGAQLTLSAQTQMLPDNAFLPSNTAAIFEAKDGTPVSGLQLRNTVTNKEGNAVQGYLYPLAEMLPAGSLSWDMSFVAGANTASANPASVLPRSVLDAQAGGAANTASQAPGSLILDDQHYLHDSTNSASSQLSPAFSVIRTGTGNLSLVAGGNFDQSSLYGIYTAGTQDPLPGGDAANAPYDLARQGVGKGDVVTGGSSNVYNALIKHSYQAYYPNGGGDVLVAAQGSATGDLLGGSISTSTFLAPSDGVGNWLWRQGGGPLGQATAWWINFGSIVSAYGTDDTGFAGKNLAQLVGFQGIGTLGGGNVTVSAGLNAGQSTDRIGINSGSSGTVRGEGLVVAVGSTGREIASNGISSVVQTGGGSLTLRVGGTLNPIDAQAYALDTNSGSNVNGAVINLRGATEVSAGAIGRDDAIYGTTPVNDPRPADPFSSLYLPSDGIAVVPGDSIVTIDTMRDLVLDGVGDAGRVTEQNLTRVARGETGTLANKGGATGFSLWSANTAIDLLAAGGNVTPVTAGVNTTAADTGYVNIANDRATDQRYVYPSQLSVISASADILYGTPAPAQNVIPLEVSSSGNQQVSFLAAGSILANNMAVDLSGADPSGLSSPISPVFTTDAGALSLSLTNIRIGAGTNGTEDALFARAPDTPTTAYLSAASFRSPALFYAAGGDIANFITGETLTFPAGSETLSQWYLAAKSVRIMASRDIVSSGTPPSQPEFGVQQNQQATPYAATSSGDVFLNNDAQSISLVSAGRDILGGYFYVGGPGLLEIDAGRNITMIGNVAQGVQELAFGSIKSLGALQAGAPASLSGGAGISIFAGLGSGADYAGFARLYLDPANQANLNLPITDPANAGRVQAVHGAELLAWLQQNYGYSGTAADALAFFLDTTNVPVASQNAFLRNVFYEELLASGQQYNDSASRFHLSYARGRQAIDTLLPGTPVAPTTDGTPQGYLGSITMASGTLGGKDGFNVVSPGGIFDAGVATEHGGNIEVLAPGGQIVLGTSGGPAPGGGTGLITNGFGNIDVFAKGSVLLGKSRIFTNAGGNIQIWSAEGDINAGIGARTTIVYNPPIINYDNTGGIVESPAVPTSGAGIATEQPLPSIPAGNIDLTAPLGTIDAGEAGVRSSGNLNLAAAVLANTAGFSAGGKTTGNAAPASVSLGAVEAAGSAAGAASNTAQNALGNRGQEQQPSVIEVEVLSVAGSESEEERRRRRGL